FYAVPMVPFMVLAVTLAAGLVIGPATAPPNRRALGAAAAGTFTLLALANLWWLYPVLTAEDIPYADWYARMLTRRWYEP
ncbi:phospholipid carrier-dependent glycosyltransferase, partial [Planomonospora corallina]